MFAVCPSRRNSPGMVVALDEARDNGWSVTVHCASGKGVAVKPIREREASIRSTWTP